MKSGSHVMKQDDLPGKPHSSQGVARTRLYAPLSQKQEIKSKFVCKFPQLERADYIIRVTFDTGFG